MVLAVSFVVFLHWIGLFNEPDFPLIALFIGGGLMAVLLFAYYRFFNKYDTWRTSKIEATKNRRRKNLEDPFRVATEVIRNESAAPWKEIRDTKNYLLRPIHCIAQFEQEAAGSLLRWIHEWCTGAPASPGLPSSQK